MTFAVSADAYDRFMGRYSKRLAPVFADFARVMNGQRVLDVGCGPGALTSELALRVGATSVVAVEPSETFVDAVRHRVTGVHVQRADAERLPLVDGVFDAALAQLVVHFMADPVAGLYEMGRVTKEGGVVAACVWDFHDGGSPLSAFWAAARAFDPDAPDERALPGTRRGHLPELLRAAGMANVEEAELSVSVVHETFDEWWEPFALGVGPAGSYVSSLERPRRKQLEERCRRALPEGPFAVKAVAWAARGTPGLAS